jgi:beta-fructofuranosidase
MEPKWWEVSSYKDSWCHFEIVDNATGGWGHINVDDFRTSDEVNPAEENPAVLAGRFHRIYDPGAGEKERWYINDHCFMSDDKGAWHLFGITREEPARPRDEDNFAHATSPELTRFPWEKKPFALTTAEGPPWNETHLWAPHVVRDKGTYHMFYCAGGGDSAKYRIHLATSRDLREWKRHPANPVVVDGYDARDPMVIRAGDEWVMYYTATTRPEGGNHIVACRTSRDLVRWGERRTVFTDPTTGKGGGPTESPFVLRRGRYYYLFIGPRGGYVGTDVFRSGDPFHFRIEDKVGHIESHAAEVIRDRDGRWYVSHCGWDQGGVYLAPLYWNDGQDDNDTTLPKP